MELFLFSTVSA